MEKDERQVAEWYNALSSSYDELYGEEQSQKHQEILEILQNKRFQTLVDIGCGTGTFLRQAHRIYRHGIGIDSSTGMLQAAKRRKTPNTDYVLANASSLPIKNGSTDCAVSISTARADSTLSSLILDLKRISAKDAVLAITVFQEPGTPILLPFNTTPVRSKTISPRETLYFFRLADSLK